MSSGELPRLVKVLDIPADAKLLVFDFEFQTVNGDEMDLDVPRAKEHIQGALNAAGLGHVEVLITRGLKSVTAIRDYPQADFSLSPVAEVKTGE